MAVAVAELQGTLTALASRASADIANLLGALQNLDPYELATFLTDAYPAAIEPWAAAAGDLTAVWYDEQPGGKPNFIPKTADLAPREQLAINARWAITQTNPVTALQGAGQRTLFDTSRRTVLDNAEAEHVRWARHASGTACGFCRMLATRSAAYRTEKSAVQGHNACHCIAVPDRDGTYEPAPHIKQWRQDYDAARAEGASTPGEIAQAMERIAAS